MTRFRRVLVLAADQETLQAEAKRLFVITIGSRLQPMRTVALPAARIALMAVLAAIAILLPAFALSAQGLRPARDASPQHTQRAFHASLFITGPGIRRGSTVGATQAAGCSERPK
jgi:hypothetical protein